MSRIASTFDSLRNRAEIALIPYLMGGYPSREASRDLLYAIVQAGADLVELGVPFSDPMADGATIQRANQSALTCGTRLRHVVDLVAEVRGRVDVPLVLMSYCNPLLRMGTRKFAEEAAAAGVDGLIVPDLPIEEAGEIREACEVVGIDLVGMVAPTSPPDRVSSVAQRASGFIYCVTLKGVTGARTELSPSARPLVRSVRAASHLPAVIGFGVSSARHVEEAAGFADGVVVASALLDRIDLAPGDPVRAASDFVGELKKACGHVERDD